MGWLLQAWRMTLRDWKAGELHLMLAALVVAVGAVSSVGLLADRLHGALERDGAQLLGADLVVVSDQPMSRATLDAAAERGLQTADVVQFPSMALAGGDDDPRAQLASVKAVSEGYPLRGTLRLRDAPDISRPATSGEAGGMADHAANGIPGPGSVWLDPRLLPQLGVEVGDAITLGDARFRVENVITVETDRGTNFVNLAPRVMMRADDLPATGLIATGSRISYHLLVAGEPSEVRGFEQWLRASAPAGVRIQTLESGRPGMRRTLDRAQQFLSLVAMLAVLIAALAIALAARRYMVRHLDGVAVMRCLGATQGSLSRLMCVEFLLVALAGSAAGGLAGYLGHLALLSALSSFIVTDLPPPSLLPAVQALAIGIWLLLGFALPSLAPLRHVPPMRVLRHDPGIPMARAAVGYALGLAGFVLLLLWVARDARLGVTASAGFAAAFAAFALLSWTGLAVVSALRGRFRRSLAWQFALAGLVRRRAATVAQMCALSMGLMALLLLAITRTDLIEGWRLAAPADAPNRFVINIQPDQYEAVDRYLKEAGLDAPLHPIIRGRLIAINGEEPNSRDFAERRARRFIDRESNLSYAASLPAHNQLVDGRWFQPGEHAISLDEELAGALDVSVGDQLTWDVAGTTIEVVVANLRRPDWDSMSVNFFVVMSPDALRHAPATWLTSLHVPPGTPDPLPGLVAQFPNLSVFDISGIVGQVQRVLDQVIAAVQGLFVFTLAAGVLVLYAALAATRDERVREAGLLRALGASRQQLERAQWLELALIGAASGILAAGAAGALASALAVFVFGFPLTPAWWVWAGGIGGGVAAALLGGQAGLRGVLRTPPLRTLRET